MTLHTAFIGGTSIPASVMRQMLDAFGAAPMVIMGMTEASPLITQTLTTDSFEQNTSSAGIPLPFTAIKVIDPANGEPVHGAGGELCIRSYGVTPGYFAMPERTADAIDAEGWLHSATWQRWTLAVICASSAAPRHGDPRRREISIPRKSRIC